MYANFEGSIGPKMTTFSTAHSETQNPKADMLRSIYLVYLRFWRDRLIIFLLVFPAQKVSKNRGCQKLWILDPIVGFPTGPHYVSRWKSTHAANPVLIPYQCTALDPYFSENKRPEGILSAARARGGKCAREGPPLNVFAFGPREASRTTYEPVLVIHAYVFWTLDTYVYCSQWKSSNTPEIGSFPIIIYVFIF